MRATNRVSVRWVRTVRLVGRGALRTLLLVSLLVSALAVVPAPEAEAQAGRVTHDLQVLYEFEEGGGTNVGDTSGVGSAFNLGIENGSYAWGSDSHGGYLELTAANRASNSNGDNKIRTACMTSDELSVEAWLTPANTTQAGPARIVTFSQDTSDGRNVTLSQNSTEFNVRLKTSDYPTFAERETTTDPVTGNLVHVVFTRDAAGNAVIYVDGTPEPALADISGTFDNWSSAYSFGIGNEFGVASNDDLRDWQGKYYLVAVYCAALTLTEVRQNYNTGPAVGPISGQIRGVAYDDWNFNIVNDGDPGLENVTVTAYRVSDGQQVGSSVVTTAGGSYTLAVPDGTEVRIEFTNPPAGYLPATFEQTATAPAFGVDAGFYKSDDVCGGGQATYQMDWGAIGWQDPPDDSSYPWVQTFPNVDGSGVDVTVTVPRQHRDGNTGYVEEPGSDYEVYAGDLEAFRFWHPDDTQIDQVIVSFSKPVLIDDLVFGGNRKNGEPYGVLEVKVYDGPDATGNVVPPDTTRHPDPSTLSTVVRGTPVDDHAPSALNITDYAGTAGPDLNGAYVASRESYVTVGLTLARNWAVVDYEDVLIQSISWELYTSSVPDPQTARDNLRTGISNSAYLGRLFFSGPCDFGDLPDSSVGGIYPTSEADDGPSHLRLDTIYMGTGWDADTDGQPDSTATGDDEVTANDEDGVASFPTFIAGQTAEIEVTVTNNTGLDATLFAFFDWNHDGLFDGPNEVVSVIVPSGTTESTIVLTVYVPADAVLDTDLGVRLRFSTEPYLTATGAARNGEVEDYLIQVSSPVAVDLASFAAIPGEGLITVEWQTASEVDLMGFVLYRAESPDGPWTQIGGDLIRSQALGSPSGASYQLVDRSVVEGVAYYYLLRAVDVHGLSTPFGPEVAELVPGSRILYRVYLPLLYRGP